RWLILNNRESEALPILSRLGEANLNTAVASIRESVKEHRESLFQRRYLIPILCAMLLAMFNQLAGINAILYYAPRIFQMAGFDQSQAFSQSIYLGIANLAFTLLAMTFIDKFGRKTLMVIGSLGMILFLCLAGSAIPTGPLPEHPTGNSNLVIYLI